MEDLVSELSEIKGVKNVKRKGDKVLKINLHSREVPGQEAEKIAGDLRKISPKVSTVLDESEEIKGWNRTRKPEKKYSETGVNTQKVSDRKPVGHEPAYYMITIKR